MGLWLPFTARRQVKPPESASINWAHPLAIGLVWLVYPGGADRHDLVSRNLGTLLTSGTWDGMTRHGTALSSSSTTNGGASWPFGASLLTITTAFTLMVRLNATSLASYGKPLTIPYANGSWSAPYASISLTRDIETTRAQLVYAGALAAFNTVYSDYGYIATTDGLTTYGATRQAAAVVFWRNGAQHSTATFDASTAVDFTNQQPVCLLNRSNSSNGEGIAGTSDVAAIWNRALTAAEVQEFSADPWALVAASPRFWLLLWQAEGGTLQELVGQADGTSSTTAALTVSRAASGQADGASTTSGELTVAGALSGQADATATATGELTVGGELTGQSNGAATATGALTVARPLAGQSNGAATAAGALAIERNLAGQADGTATATGSLTLGSTMEGQADGAATASGALTVQRNLAGQSDGAASVGGALTVSRTMAGQADGQSSASAELLVPVELVGQSDATSGASGGATTHKALAGVAAGVSTIAALLAVTRPLMGVANGSGQASGALTVGVSTPSGIYTLGGNVVGTYTLAGNLVSTYTLGGSVLSAYTLGGKVGA